jgi:hypothetical protein
MFFMSRYGQDFSDDVQLALKRYSIARQKASLYIETLQNESERLFSHFVRYAKENTGEPRGFSETLQAFYYNILNMECDSHDRAIRSSLTKRFKKLMKRHIRDNSNNQVKLEEFLF